MLHLRTRRQKPTVLVIFHSFNIGIREKVRLGVLARTKFLRQRARSEVVAVDASAGASVSVNQLFALRTKLLNVKVVVIVIVGSTINVGLTVFRTVKSVVVLSAWSYASGRLLH